MERTLGAPRPTFRRIAGAWFLAAWGAAVLGGCAGGSGSSGFDIVAAENRAIDNAIGSGGCVVERGLTICASEAVATPAPSATPTHTALPSRTGTPGPVQSETATPPLRTATPTGTSLALPSATRTGTAIGASPTATATRGVSQPSVDIQPEAGDVANCAGSADSQSCVVRFVFVSAAAPADAAYRAAVRARSPDSAWRVLPVEGNAVEVQVPAGVRVIQTAILLYDRDPGPVPSEIQALSESGADFAFVAAPLVVRAPSPSP
ncbi:hypothetical protein KF840_23260 [bacterium]|nr:hypothetical protein [bacterium]